MIYFMARKKIPHKKQLFRKTNIIKGNHICGGEEIMVMIQLRKCEILE